MPALPTVSDSSSTMTSTSTSSSASLPHWQTSPVPDRNRPSQLRHPDPNRPSSANSISPTPTPSSSNRLELAGPIVGIMLVVLAVFGILAFALWSKRRRAQKKTATVVAVSGKEKEAVEEFDGMNERDLKDETIKFRVNDDENPFSDKFAIPEAALEPASLAPPLQKIGEESKSERKTL
ncbi:hypothetical protein RUND412_003917 [Rhizina undulata]